MRFLYQSTKPQVCQFILAWYPKQPKKVSYHESLTFPFQKTPYHMSWQGVKTNMNFSCSHESTQSGWLMQLECSTIPNTTMLPASALQPLITSIWEVIKILLECYYLGVKLEAIQVSYLWSFLSSARYHLEVKQREKSGSTSECQTNSFSNARSADL